MRDDGQPARLIVRGAGVVLLDPVRLDHDMLAGLDEIRREVDGGDGGLDLPAQQLGVVIRGLAADDGDVRGAEGRR